MALQIVTRNFGSKNEGGPFAGVVYGSTLKLSYDSYLFEDGSDMSTATRLTMPPTTISSDTKVYLDITFNAGTMQSAIIKVEEDWWPGYPNTVKYSADTKRIDKQTNLYACIFSVVTRSSLPVRGKYVSSDEELLVYRHVYNNLMIMQSCKYFFLLPAPCAPEIN